MFPLKTLLPNSFEHFVLISEALNEMGLWNEEDKFFYDITLGSPHADPIQLRIKYRWSYNLILQCR